MKEGWKYEKLKNICNILNGFAFKSSKYVSEGIRVIRIANVQKSCVIDSQPKFYPSSELPNIKNYLLQEGDLLMSLTGNVGRVGFIDATLLPAALNQRVACLRLKTTHINIRYLYHYLNSDLFENICIANSTGAAQLNMSTVWLANHIIPLPPLSEQERIVSLLDAEFAKIDAIKANAEKQLQDAKALFQSALKDYLTPKEGWEEKTLKEIGKTQTGCTPSMSKKEFYNEEYMPFIKPSEINYDGLGGINYNTQMLSKLGAENGRVFQPYSIFMVCIGATISKLGISEREISCNQQINVLTPKDLYHSKFIYYAMLNPTFINLVKKEGTSAQATLPIISKGKWEQLKIKVPQYTDQQQIAEQLDKISTKIQSLQSNFDTTVTLCNDLKQSILKDIFG